MKAFVSFLVAIAMTFSVIGCGGGSTVGDENDPEGASDAEQEDTDETGLEDEGDPNDDGSDEGV